MGRLHHTLVGMNEDTEASQESFSGTILKLMRINGPRSRNVNIGNLFGRSTNDTEMLLFSA